MNTEFKYTEKVIDGHRLCKTNPFFWGKGGKYHNDRLNVTIALEYGDHKRHRMKPYVKKCLDKFIDMLIMQHRYNFQHPNTIWMKYIKLIQLQRVWGISKDQLDDAIEILMSAGIAFTSIRDGKSKWFTKAKILYGTEKTIDKNKNDIDIKITFNPTFIQVLGIEKIKKELS